MERRTRIQPGTAQNWRSEPHTSQPVLFPSCLCLCLIICTDMRSLFFPYYRIYVRSSIFYQFILLKEFLWIHRNAFRSMKSRNWNALQHTAKESCHTESTVKLAPKWKRKFLCQGPVPFHATLQSLSQGGYPVSSLRAATLWFSRSWWFLPGALDASCVIWTHWI